MSGPALSRLYSHHAIHDAAFGEAEELTELFAQKLREGDERAAQDVGHILLEHWETRTLAHAQAEEEGLYREAREQFPELAVLLVELTRDHDLLRMVANEIRALLSSGEELQEIEERFYGMLTINRLHSQAEETYLIPQLEAGLSANAVSQAMPERGV